MYHRTTIPLAGCVNPPQQLTDTADDRLPAGRRSAGRPVSQSDIIQPSACRGFATLGDGGRAQVSGLPYLPAHLPIWIVRFVFHRI